MKKIVVSLLASSLLFGAGVYAGAGLEQVKAYKNPFDISIDGKATEFNNTPLLYNNITYLPLAEMSAKLGVAVEWNAKEKKVEVKKNISIPGATGMIVTANEGGSLTFLDVATQKQKELKLMGSVHNVQVSPDGKTVWATVVPGGGHDDKIGESHEAQQGTMNMVDHSKMADQTDMNMTEMAKMMVQNGMNMADHAKIMDQNGMNMADHAKMMDEKVMAEHAAKLGVTLEKMKEVHQKMMSEMMASGNMEQMMKDGMMSDEMMKKCAELLGVPFEKVKELHESMAGSKHGHAGEFQQGESAHSTDSHGQTGGKLVVIDAASMKIIKEMNVGAHPAHVVLSTDGKYTLVTDSESNQVSIIDAKAFQKIKDVPVGNMPHGTRISADGKWAYIANMGESTVSVVDIVNQKEVKKMEVGKTPVQVGVTKDGNKLAATLNGEDALAIVDLASGKVQKVKVGDGPAQVYVDPSDKFAYVANQGTEASPSETVSKIDLATGKEIYQVKTGAGAHGVTTSADGKYVFVTNMFADTLTVLEAETGKVLADQQIGDKPNGIAFIQ